MMTTIAPILALSASMLLAPSQDVTLRRTFTAGQKEVFTTQTRVQMNIDLSSFGQDNMTYTMTQSSKMSIEYGSTGDDGKTAITMTFSDMKMDMSGLPGMESLPGGMLPESYVVKAKIDALNVLSDLTLEGLNEQQRAAVQTGIAFLQASFPVFPEQAIKVGDSWETSLPENKELGLGASTIKTTYNGLMDVGGKPMIKLTSTTKMPMAMNPASMMGGGGEGMPAMNVTGQMEIEVEFYLDPQTRAIADSNTKGRMQQVMEMVDMGFKIPMQGNIVGTMKRSS